MNYNEGGDVMMESSRKVLCWNCRKKVPYTIKARKEARNIKGIDYLYDEKYAVCDECGEEIVRIDEYEVGKKYYCSECDEEIDLSEQYAEVKPIITVEEIIIK